MLEIWHTLHMILGYDPRRDDHSIPGWTLSRDKTAAVWGTGFESFLDVPDTLEAAMATML